MEDDDRQSIVESEQNTILNSDNSYPQEDKNETLEQMKNITAMLLENDLIKSIPPIGIFIAMIKSVSSVTNYLFIKKISQLLNELENLTAEERSRIYWNLECDEKKREQYGEQVLMLLNSFTETEAARLMGKAIQICTRENISKEDLFRIYYVLKNCFISDLESYAKCGDTISRDNSLAFSLYPFGFFNYDSGYIVKNQVLDLNPDKPLLKSKFGFLVCHVLYGSTMPTSEEYAEKLKAK